MLIILLAVAGGVAGLVALLLSLANLRRRVSALEARLALGGDEALPVPEAVEPEPVAASWPPERDEPAPQAPPEAAAAPAMPPPLPAAARVPSEPSLVALVWTWLQENWFYAVAAVSLALAGIFAAQYAAERGLLSPTARVMLAAAFGALLIGAGEVIRRRWGDAPETATAYLPSVFSGAGVVTLYGAVLTAQMLYGLITPAMSLGLLVMVAVLAIVLGWFYGPLLALVGLLGACAAPFLAGGAPGSEWMIAGYFGLVMLSGLSINALKKWRAVDELALIAPFAAMFQIAHLSQTWAAALAYFALVPVIGSVFLGGALRPCRPAQTIVAKLQSGAALIEIGWRDFFMRLVWIGAVAGLFSVIGAEEPQLAAALAALTGLTLLATFWSLRAPGAVDFALVAVAGLYLLAPRIVPTLVDMGEEYPAQVSATLFYLLIAAGAVISLACAWRSARGVGRDAIAWAIGAAVAGPGLLVLQEVMNAPGAVIGANTWAGIAMGFAALATLLAERAWHRDAPDRERVSLAVLAALSLIALALFIWFTKAALSVALAVLVLSAVLMDLRWKLPRLAGFAQVGVMVLVWRTLVDPGLFWGVDHARWFEIVLAYGAPALALLVAAVALRSADRPLTRAALEGGGAVVLAMGASVVLIRAFEATEHLVFGLTGASWWLAGWALLRTASVTAPKQEAGRLARFARLLRLTLGWLDLAVASLALLLALALNPLVWRSFEIVGPVFFNSMTFGYLLPGLIILAMAVTLKGLKKAVRIIFAGFGSVLVLAYLFFSVAQIWRGNRPAALPMGEGELWSYTALLLLIGAGLLGAALWRRSNPLRYLADAVLVVAIIKVFFVDAADLGGLVRAGSFLILGLALAGLAWVNRRAALASVPPAPES
ncbi:putative membrane protein [Rhodobacter aestuarii]|uniref:Uncharacterized membrane protein n=1 Tax=Rhodobacter aestuarii TaxID=453582 RepID=A0A1N7NTZ0_9RHOB|nr:DUF2339 domain-containing protein [Rhodobacter aestuarii]PTV94551.1 putative membrane protein [Rhodobacter aestuarii]SIT01833.1 Uncharacterized membrane protein [Rhodobacter aestuarii]